jgi:hypothetical protein
VDLIVWARFHRFLDGAAGSPGGGPKPAIHSRLDSALGSHRCVALSSLHRAVLGIPQLQCLCCDQLRHFLRERTASRLRRGVQPQEDCRVLADPSASLERGETVNEFASTVERPRHELLVHCYRILGSLPDAEDAVPETLVRAWRYRDSVKGGAPLRPSLYRVATNACLESMSAVWFPASSETFQ